MPGPLRTGLRFLCINCAVENARNPHKTPSKSIFGELLHIHRILLQLLRNFRKRREFLRKSLEQRRSGLGSSGSVVNRDLMKMACSVSLPQRYAGISTVLTQNVIRHINEAKLP